MTRQLISSGSQFEQDIGYSRAVVDDEWVFVSGTTGFDYAAMTISDSLLEQTEQCMKNIQSALRQAGADFTDVVRVTGGRCTFRRPRYRWAASGAARDRRGVC